MCAKFEPHGERKDAEENNKINPCNTNIVNFNRFVNGFRKFRIPLMRCDAVRCINLMCRHRFWSTLICYWALLERNDSEATMKPELDSGETKKLSPKRVTDVLQSAAPKAQQQNQNAKEIRNTHFLLSFHFKQFSQVCLHLPDRIQMEIEWPLELIKMDREKESRIIKWASAKLRIGKCIINWFARIHFVLYALSV